MGTRCAALGPLASSRSWGSLSLKLLNRGGLFFQASESAFRDRLPANTARIATASVGHLRMGTTPVGIFLPHKNARKRY